MANTHVPPKNDEQRISMGWIIITNTSIFVESVGKWDNKPSDENTWPNLKTHFTAAHINYNKSRPVDKTAQHLYTNQANNLEQVQQ